MEGAADRVADKGVGTADHQRTGESETIPQKKTDPLCTCPQKCYERVTLHVKESLLTEFNSLGDSAKQNEFLQSYIEMRSVYKRLWSEEERVGGRLQRRVSCKYKIPIKDQESINDTPVPKVQTSSKGKTTNMVNIKEGVRTTEVCQKAFMNIYGITEKRVRLQREKLIAKLRSQSLETEFESLQDEKVHTKGVNRQFSAPEWSPEQAILDAFFGNQLWRPEYIGMPTDGAVQLTKTHNVKA